MSCPKCGGLEEHEGGIHYRCLLCGDSHVGEKYRAAWEAHLAREAKLAEAALHAREKHDALYGHKKKRAKCAHIDCDRDAHTRGNCQMHYTRIMDRAKKFIRRSGGEITAVGIRL